MLSKSWENFMFWIIQYLRKLNKYKRHFFDRLLYQDHTNFYVYHRPNEKTNDMWKKLSLMLDSSQKKIKVLLAISWFPTYTDSLLLPGVSLLHSKYLVTKPVHPTVIVNIARYIIDCQGVKRFLPKHYWISIVPFPLFLSQFFWILHFLLFKKKSQRFKTNQPTNQQMDNKLFINLLNLLKDLRDFFCFFLLSDV